MAAQTGTKSRQHGSTTAGTVTLGLGVLFTAAVAYTYLLSLSPSSNPPDWVRVVGLVWLPIGFAGVPIAYSLARTGPGRDLGRLGIAVGLVGLVALIALFVAIG